MNASNNFNKLLTIFLLFIGVMIISRCIYSGTLRYVFLIWNIFLAWLPYTISDLLKYVNVRQRLKTVLILGSWLVFFPNALYIITDLIHLRAQTNVPVWYDAGLLFCSSFAGILMAFISLRRVELFVRSYLSEKAMRTFVPVILFLGAFGVYLGRFRRWNSWDVLNEPSALAYDIGSRILLPHHYLQTWGITAVLTALYFMLYCIMKMIPVALSESTAPLKKGT